MEDGRAAQVPPPDSSRARRERGHQPAVRTPPTRAMDRRRHRRRVLDLLPPQRLRRDRLSRRRRRQARARRQENHPRATGRAGVRRRGRPGKKKHGTVRPQRRLLPPPRSEPRRLRARPRGVRETPGRDLPGLARIGGMGRRDRGTARPGGVPTPAAATLERTFERDAREGRTRQEAPARGPRRGGQRRRRLGGDGRDARERPRRQTDRRRRATKEGDKNGR
mmetsp:Transcript_8192/g.32284  ORF Transcript_8192/g.32284 Transcript_8192/m.32284 type:complete len:222 (+) Transcript_8192:409-1074(+)